MLVQLHPKLLDSFEYPIEQCWNILLLFINDKSNLNISLFVEGLRNTGISKLELHILVS